MPGFTGLIAGQLLIALTQPLAMALIAKLARVWFAPAQQLRATSIGTLALLVGLALAFTVLPPTSNMSIAITPRIHVLAFLALTSLSFLTVPPTPAPPFATGPASKTKTTQ